MKILKSESKQEIYERSFKDFPAYTLFLFQLVPMHQSCGGMSGDGSQSYAATVISAAKVIKHGVRNSALLFK